MKMNLISKITSIILSGSIVIFGLGCGSNDSSQKNSTPSPVTENKYPITDYLGRVWGYDWSKILAFYDGDNRFEGNNVELVNNEYIILKAYKKDNQDSIAEVSTRLQNATGFDTEVNLVKDNKYSNFQVLAIAKDYIKTSEPLGNLNSTSRLSFIAGLTVQKNKIIYWWSIYNSITHNYYLKEVGEKSYNFDLTSLVNDGSDIKVKITSNNSDITFTVYNEANDSVIFEKTLDLNQTKITNFVGFNIASFRSRVRDDKANKNGEEAIEISENIVNDFNALSSSNINSVDDFLNNLGFTPATITVDDFADKLIITGGGSLIYFNNDNTYEQQYYDGEKKNGAWTIEKDVLILDNKVYVAIKNKKGSLFVIKGYGDSGWFDDNSVSLNATKNTVITSSDDLVNLLDNNTPIDTLSKDDISGKTWDIDENTFNFNNDGTFTLTFTDEGETKTLSGNWDVNNNVVILTFDDIEEAGVAKMYIVSISGIKVFVGTDENGKIVFGKTAE
jgi:hypothetical protein